MRTYLVTGGAGFIGSCFIRDLLAGDPAATVINVDKLTYAGNLDSLAEARNDPRHHFVLADIADGAAMAELFAAHRPDAVVNFAAESHVDRSIDGPRAFVQTNVMGTFELLLAGLAHWRSLDAAGQAAFRFLHVSTDEVFGSLGETGKFREDTPYAPNSPYSASKAAADHFVRAFHPPAGLPTLTTNCSNNYGPYQFPEKLIPLVILNAAEGKPLPVYGDGQNVRDWLYVGDHCAAIRTVLAKGRVGETYNIGGECERANLQVVESICDLVDELRPNAEGPRRRLIHFVKDRPGHDRRYAIDTGRIASELGWRPSETFETGLRRTVAWYLEQTTWIDAIRTGKYRGERLGLAVAN